MDIFGKPRVSAEFRLNRLKFYGNCTFPQNLRTTKLGTSTVFYAVKIILFSVWFCKWEFVDKISLFSHALCTITSTILFKVQCFQKFSKTLLMKQIINKYKTGVYEQICEYCSNKHKYCCFFDPLHACLTLSRL